MGTLPILLDGHSEYSLTSYSNKMQCILVINQQTHVWIIKYILKVA